MLGVKTCPVLMNGFIFMSRLGFHLDPEWKKLWELCGSFFRRTRRFQHIHEGGLRRQRWLWTAQNKHYVHTQAGVCLLTHQQVLWAAGVTPPPRRSAPSVEAPAARWWSERCGTGRTGLRNDSRITWKQWQYHLMESRWDEKMKKLVECADVSHPSSSIYLARRTKWPNI